MNRGSHTSGTQKRTQFTLMWASSSFIRTTKRDPGQPRETSNYSKENQESKGAQGSRDQECGRLQQKGEKVTRVQENGKIQLGRAKAVWLTIWAGPWNPERGVRPWRVSPRRWRREQVEYSEVRAGRRTGTSTARRTETWEQTWVEISTAHATLSTYNGSVGSQITTVKCLQLSVQG